MPLCAQLLDDLLPMADTCAVNGALVCFMGAHAHRVGLLLRRARRAGAGRAGGCTQALDTPPPARRPGLGGRRRAPRWPASAARGADQPGAPACDGSVTCGRCGYRGRTAYLRDAKGLHDLAALLARPGADCPPMELAGAGALPAARSSATDPVLDRAALAAYRRRLADLDEELARRAAGRPTWRGVRRASDEREQLLAELRRATRPGGASRALGPTAAERARKAVTARIRDAIRRIGAGHPGARRPPRPHRPDRRPLPVRPLSRRTFRTPCRTRCAAARVPDRAQCAVEMPPGSVGLIPGPGRDHERPLPRASGRGRRAGPGRWPTTAAPARRAYSSRNSPVTASMRSLGAGPIPRQVTVPGSS